MPTLVLGHNVPYHLGNQRLTDKTVVRMAKNAIPDQAVSAGDNNVC